MNEQKLRELEEAALEKLRSPEVRLALERLRELSEQVRELQYLRWLEEEQEKDKEKAEK